MVAEVKGKLLILPLSRNYDGFHDRLPRSEGIVHLLPSKLISRNDAMLALSQLIPTGVSLTTPFELSVPPYIRVRAYPDGLEIYDTFSERPLPRAPSEALSDISFWVKHWYFSAFRTPEDVMGRLIDKTSGKRCSGLELPLSGFSGGRQHTLTSFILALERHEVSLGW
jgi:hypothetical protein